MMGRFLVIDDDLAVCETLTAILRHDFDAEVEQAHTAVQGRHLLAGSRFDLVLIDVMLSDGSGVDLATFAVNENVPVLLISGHPELQIELSLAGYPFLPKPFGSYTLRATAEMILADAAENIRRVTESSAQPLVNMTRFGMKWTKHLDTSTIALGNNPRRLRVLSYATNAPKQVYRLMGRYVKRILII
jgi:DNA-binding response OmpR family regulator